MKHLFKILFFVSLWASSQNASRTYLSHEQTGDVLKISVSDGSYLFKFYSPEIVETTFLPTGESYNPESHAVVLKPVSVKAQLIESTGVLAFTSSELEVRIQRKPFQVSYRYNGQMLVSEKSGYSKAAKSQNIEFNLDEQEALYGGGARALGLNRRGNKLQLYNRAHYGYETRSELMNFTMPLVLSSKLYALHFDNPTVGWLDLDSKKDNTLNYESLSGRTSYQVIAGSNWKKLVSNYTALTGRQPMPPRWAFGNFSSRFGYHSQNEAEATIGKFKSEKIPVDAIILDLYWFGKDVKGTMGNLEIFRDSFPDFEKMVSNFNKQGVKTVLITEPFVLTTSSKWNEAVSKKILATDKSGNPFTYDFYFGNTGLIDIFKPEGRDWFWNIYKDLASKGVAGVWGDLGEPEVHPSDLQHATGSADELHNIYGHNWAKLVFDGYKKDFPNERPFILMRSGYSGSQRFGMIPWSGDVNRTWGGLQSQPEIALEMGMQGMGYMHSDLGGFAGANLDDELYVRWLQYGVFNPVFRPHAQEDVPSEPVFRSGLAKMHAKNAIELRYKMLPYNYSLAFENHKSGLPLMRPMLFEDPSQTNTTGQYFWGNDLLVVPVLEAGQKTKLVHFPKSGNWFDFYSKQKYIGGQSLSIPLTLDKIPVFVRGGSFIPLVNTVQSTSDYNLENLDIHYYFDALATSSKSQIYHDDGLTNEAFEKGKFEILNLASQFLANELVLTLKPETGKNAVVTGKKINLIVHNINEKFTLKINGEKSRIKSDPKNKTLSIPIQWHPTAANTIQIQFKK